jgi:hypothetical protein
MRKFFTRRRPNASGPKKRRRKLRTAGLALGLVTAWGSESLADARLKLELTPEQTLTNALVMYGNNVSTAFSVLLGTVPGGVTTTYFHDMRDSEIVGCDWVCDPESYLPGGNKASFYAVIGLYEGAEGTGVTVSFPNDDSIVNMETWESTFQHPSAPSFYRFEKPTIISDLLAAAPHPMFPKHVITEHVEEMLEAYGEPDAYLGGPIATDYGTNAVLVNFSEAAFGGTAFAELVPEPASWMLLVSAAGMAIGIGRRRGA